MDQPTTEPAIRDSTSPAHMQTTHAQKKIFANVWDFFLLKSIMLNDKYVYMDVYTIYDFLVHKLSFLKTLNMKQEKNLRDLNILLEMVYMFLRPSPLKICGLCFHMILSVRAQSFSDNLFKNGTKHGMGSLEG
jgi:hypothetical protein